MHLQLAAQGFTAMCPPLGAVAVILFAAPGIPAAKPYNVAIGFLAGSAAAYGIYTGLGSRPFPSPTSDVVPGVHCPQHCPQQADTRYLRTIDGTWCLARDLLVGLHRAGEGRWGGGGGMRMEVLHGMLFSHGVLYPTLEATPGQILSHSPIDAARF